ncbi:MAG: type II toxin-antitoxin system RelE/ParE family toxin [Candidatus Aenigmatarchaeota archaeon]
MYKVIFDDRIEKDLSKIPAIIIKNIFKKITLIKENPYRKGVKKLIGIEGYRLRIGNYRVLFQIDEEAKTIKIYRIIHRKDAYK